MRESPPQTVQLDAYFISKYEMTQGQWLRLTGEAPSRHVPGGTTRGPEIDWRHPVEWVSWNDCVEVLGRMGLTLPTEAQWEYSARVGENAPWWTGADQESAYGRVNLADRSALRAGEEWTVIEDVPGNDDG